MRAGFVETVKPNFLSNLRKKSSNDTTLKY